MESQPQNPEFRIDPENFHPCSCVQTSLHLFVLIQLSQVFLATTHKAHKLQYAINYGAKN